MNKKDIAIVGMSGIFADSEDLSAFWQNLRAGRELVRHESHAAPGGNFVPLQSVISGRHMFDPAFFGYTWDEATLMDPQVRVLHEQVWKALQDAGIDPYTYAQKIGLYAGVSEHQNWAVFSMLEKQMRPVDAYMASALANRTFAATLIAYKLNLRGPALFVDTACSTSLVAVHMACRSLLTRECQVAVAAAACIRTDDATGYWYQEGMIFSRDGHCKTFDADASGTFGGEGAGVVVLKRMEDALKDGDNIYAVIRGSAVNNDGHQKAGYTAPGVSGQVDCIMAAHQFAGVAPETITYVEAHGTATHLGDPVEIEALNKAFGHRPEKTCAIGSVKTNLGHLDAAAGIAGLIKTALALHHRELPPSLHFTTANPAIDFARGPFFVNDSLRRWEAPAGQPLRAGVSAFGIGGTNAHVVLEAAPTSPASPSAGRYQLLLSSGHTVPALQANTAALQQHILETASHPQNEAFTLHSRRKHFRHRQFLVHDSEALSQSPFSPAVAPERSAAPRLVFLFPGQGSQYLHMARDLYAHIPAVQKTIDHGLTLIAEQSGQDLRALFLQAADAQQLQPTTVAQPLLFIVEYALARYLMSTGLKPAYLIGHSLGELTAACLSGVFSFETGISLVLQRSTFMGGMQGGAMLAVAAPVTMIKGLIAAPVEVASINTADHCVLSGPEAAIQACAANLRRQGIATTRLATAHAFHSAMMEPAMPLFEEAITTLSFSLPGIPFFSNVNGRLAGAAVTQPAYWAAHIRRPVLFADSIRTLMEQDDLVFMEIGPGHALTSFCRHIAEKEGRLRAIIPMMPRSTGSSEVAHWLQALGQLWQQGVSVSWETLSPSGGGQAVRLPGYLFDRRLFPAPGNAIDSIRGRLQNQVDQTRRPSTDWWYTPSWEMAPLPRHTATLSRICNRLLFSDGSDWSALLAAQLRTGDSRLVMVCPGTGYEWVAPDTVVLDPAVGTHFRQLGDDLAARGFTYDDLIYTWTTLEASAGEHYFRLQQLYTGLRLPWQQTTVRCWLISDVLHRITGNERRGDPAAAVSQGFARVFPQEVPGAFACMLDIDSSEPAGLVAATVHKELLHNNDQPRVCLRNGLRWTESFRSLAMPANTTGNLCEQGVYLLTGGLGQLGSCLAEHLLARWQATVLLVGRTPLHELNETPLSRLKALQQVYPSLHYIAADAGDADGMQHCLEQIRRWTGRLDGIFHLAGSSRSEDYQLLEQQTPETTHVHFQAKTAGLLQLRELVAAFEPAFVCLTSSISTVLGGIAFGAYAAANSFMDSFAAYWVHPHTRMISIALDGLSLGEKDDHHITISREEVINIFEQALQLEETPQVIVSVTALEVRRRHAIALVQAAVATETTSAIAPVLMERPLLRNSYTPPATQLEVALEAIWSRGLGIDRIGVHDNFFELGGDSLKAMSLLRAILAQCEIDISLHAFFESPTISGCAAYVNIHHQAVPLFAKESDADKMEIII